MWIWIVSFPKKAVPELFLGGPPLHTGTVSPISIHFSVSFFPFLEYKRKKLIHRCKSTVLKLVGTIVKEQLQKEPNPNIWEYNGMWESLWRTRPRDAI